MLGNEALIFMYYALRVCQKLTLFTNITHRRLRAIIRISFTLKITSTVSSMCYKMCNVYYINNCIFEKNVGWVQLKANGRFLTNVTNVQSFLFDQELLYIAF